MTSAPLIPQVGMTEWCGEHPCPGIPPGTAEET
ncbi:hypothetical protein SAMN05421870_105320 [Streptomyces qinglanensis]|uniref:Uncharacterized protein n=1 Tax=Streptomyces qinglanensis TaxID=943816 RepID=A0A1H9T4K5_9ACTN|nr:hypothetical protein SAMN05421870_105320 [Streptomyces qinglanensis]